MPPATSDASSPTGKTPKKGGGAWKVLCGVLAACAVGCGGVYGLHAHDAAKEAARSAETPVVEVSAEPEVVLVDNPIDFRELQLANSDVYAWVYVPETNVNLPVVQHPSDDFYYIDHNVDRESSYEGSAYTQRCNALDFSDPCTVIYGHNNVDGQMFSTLHFFENEEFFDAQTEFYIYTPGHILRYEIVSAFMYDNRHILNSFDFTNEESRMKFFDTVVSPDSLVMNVAEGASLDADDQVVVLSTCMSDGDTINRRYLVCGKLVEDTLTY